MISGLSSFSFLGKQWLNSLKFFLPKNITLFLLVSLNAMWQAWKIIGFYFWWIFLIEPAMVYLNPFILTLHNWVAVSLFMTFFLPVVQLAILCIIILALRPSVALKNYHYFSHYTGHFLSYLMVIGIIFFIMVMGTIFSVTHTFTAFLNPMVQWFFIQCSMSFMIFSAFFCFDAPLTPDVLLSFWRGFKMVWYGLPFCLVCTIIFYSLGSLCAGFLSSVASVAPGLIAFIFYIGYYILLSLLIAVFNNFYLKRAHEDYDLYF
ncbi:MAG: hypothetical protein AB7R69_04560 [Candidatus Babeliales bacterium]